MGLERRRRIEDDSKDIGLSHLWLGAEGEEGGWWGEWAAGLMVVGST